MHQDRGHEGQSILNKFRAAAAQAAAAVLLLHSALCAPYSESIVIIIMIIFNFFLSHWWRRVREALNTVLLGLCAAVKVINSQKRRVNVEKLRELTLEVYLTLVTGFPRAVVSPSVHRILAHSWELIELNGEW